MAAIIASFEKSEKDMVKKTVKARRRNIPGMVERQEMSRLDCIERDAYVEDLIRRFGNLPMSMGRKW